MPRKRPDADRRHAIELYTSGLTITAVAQTMGAEDSWVGYTLKEAGVTRTLSEARILSQQRSGAKPHNFRRDLPVADIVRRYQAGESASKIGEDLGFTDRVTHRVLHDQGIAIRSCAQARLLIDRQQASALGAERKARLVGWGEDTLYQWLVERGEHPDRQRPEGTKSIDLALAPIAVEVWVSSVSPLHDPYCRQRIEYLGDRGWSCLYVFVARRTRVLLPAVADEIIARLQLARAQPAAPRQHWVIRGCGELAATVGDDLRDWTVVPPSKDCPHHSSVNHGLAG